MSDSFLELLEFNGRKPKADKMPVKYMSAKTQPYRPALQGGDLNQRVYVDFRYKSLTGNNAKSLSRHVGYMTREGKSLEGGKPELYTADGRDINTNPIEGENRFFKIIISPENGALNNPQYVKDFMEGLEKCAGQKLDWFAASHNNTEHPHTHVVIRGVSEGKELTLDPRIIKTHSKTLAVDLANQHIGLRTELELKIQRERELVANRPIGLDTAITKRIQQSVIENLAAIPVKRDWISKAKSENLHKEVKSMLANMDSPVYFEPKTDREKQRMEHLSKLSLASQYSRGYMVMPNYKDTLSDMQIRRDINRSIAHQYPIEKFGELKSLRNASTGIAGTVVMREEDEKTGKFYAVVRTNENQLYLVNSNSKAIAHLHEGEQIRVSSAGVIRSLDRNLYEAIRRDNSASHPGSEERSTGPNINRNVNTINPTKHSPNEGETETGRKQGLGR